MNDQATPDGVRSNDPATKLARKHLSVLELARELSSIAETCRRSGMNLICHPNPGSGPRSVKAGI